MLKEWLESQIKSILKKQLTEENITAIIAATLEKLEKQVKATDTKIDDAAWYVANVLLTDPVVVHEICKLIQEAVE
ncbi:MAG: hypothetical protein Q4A17_03385 [Thermoguttaceae bacterium]|nr:hypothetical protein [Thermoguttaceae bacterium]